MTGPLPESKKPKTSIRDCVAGCVALVTAFTLGVFAVLYGEGYVYSQKANPVIGDSLWHLSAGVVTLFTLIVGLFGLVVALGIINSFGEPVLKGKTEYTIIGIGGLLGTITGAFISLTAFIDAIGLISSLAPTGSGESVVALVAVAAPFAYAFYQFYNPSIDVIGKDSPQPTLDPEVVRKKGEVWSEDAPGSQIATPSTSSGSGVGVNSKQPPDQSEDFSDFEYRWVTETDVTFDDIGGMDSLKRELTSDVIKPLTTHRDQAKELGVFAPNILFHGPPGTGKTYLAKGLATELGLPFVKLSGADIQTKWINESSQMVKKLFDEAREVSSKEGGAVVFLDELDSVLKSRGSGHSHNEDKKVVNEFLNHLEETAEHDIVFIGATNRVDALDDAGIRAGRIDRKIHIGKPDMNAREAILQAQLDDRAHALTENQIGWIASNTSGWVAADLEQCVQQAASNVLARDGEVTAFRDVKNAFESK